MLGHGYTPQKRKNSGSTTTALPIGRVSENCASGAKAEIKLRERTPIGMWNICMLQQCGEVQQLTHWLKQTGGALWEWRRSDGQDMGKHFS